MRILVPIVLALVAGALLPASGAARTATSTISISAQTANKPVGGLVWATHGKTATISGNTGDGLAGEAVELQASAFPFTSGFATLGQTQTGSGGSYSFTAKPTVATRYRVALVSAPTSPSSTITVYVGLSWSGHTRGRCAAGASSCSLSFSGKVVYPAAVAKSEGAKIAYYYFAVRYGSQTTPPSAVRLVKTGAQSHVGHRYEMGFSVTFATVKAYRYEWEICTKDTEAQDGIGLPGHHHCGDRSISDAALQEGYIG